MKLPKMIYSRLSARILTPLVVGILVCVLFSACKDSSDPSPSNETSDRSTEPNTIILPGITAFDSADTAVLVRVDLPSSSITLRNLEVDRNYTLSVEGYTLIANSYGEAITLAQLKLGEVLDVTFLKAKKTLTSIQISPSAWRYDQITNFSYNELRKEFRIADETFYMDTDTLLFSQGESILPRDLNPTDVIRVVGIGTDISSILVEKGHGYLRLDNEETFIGGFIEVGQVSITRIREGMLLTVPEGKYEVLLSKNGSGGRKPVQISRDTETILDVSDLVVETIPSGYVRFTIEPSDASLYIDGELMESSAAIQLPYGLHQVMVKANGYQTLIRYLQVGEASAELTLVLEAVTQEEPDETQESSTSEDVESTSSETSQTSQTDSSQAESSSSVSSTEETTSPTASYLVHVEAPRGVEVYVEGNYVGLAPCSFPKQPGSVDITLRLYGYENRSFTLSIDTKQEDSYFSFPDLIPLMSPAS
ncbi:MAG: PEGA domain-containing protein [Clostridium sp.]|jgi:hypothetical protein|nr:PEGA domain-containing protein [Clostridium sp.]